jgi:hypothetical protein
VLLPQPNQPNPTKQLWMELYYYDVDISSNRQLITANLATGDVVVMGSNSLQYCTKTVIALVYRPRFKITRSIDHTNEGLYLQCCHDNCIMHNEINLNQTAVKDLK